MNNFKKNIAFAIAISLFLTPLTTFTGRGGGGGRGGFHGGGGRGGFHGGGGRSGGGFRGGSARGGSFHGGAGLAGGYRSGAVRAGGMHSGAAGRGKIAAAHGHGAHGGHGHGGHGWHGGYGRGGYGYGRGWYGGWGWGFGPGWGGWWWPTLLTTGIGLSILSTYPSIEASNYVATDPYYIEYEGTKYPSIVGPCPYHGDYTNDHRCYVRRVFCQKHGKYHLLWDDCPVGMPTEKGVPVEDYNITDYTEPVTGYHEPVSDYARPAAGYSTIKSPRQATYQKPVSDYAQPKAGYSTIKNTGQAAYQKPANIKQTAAEINNGKMPTYKVSRDNPLKPIETQTIE